MKRKPRVWLIHGFNVRDGGAGSIQKLKPFIEAAGFEVKSLHYGWRFLLGAYFGNRRIARMLADAVDPGDYAIGHSNGCAIIHRAMHLGADIDRAAYINAALDADAPVASKVERLCVWFSPSDIATGLAGLIPWSLWGDMGGRGYRGKPDSRVLSFNKETGFSGPSSKSHSDVFTGARLAFYGPRIVSALISRQPEPNRI